MRAARRKVEEQSRHLIGRAEGRTHTALSHDNVLSIARQTRCAARQWEWAARVPKPSEDHEARFKHGETQIVQDTQEQ